LVWGGHRLAASQSLGHKMIAAIAVDRLGWDHGHRENADLDDFVKMTEIAENLHRSDLTTQERNEQLAIWVALLEKRTPISDAAQPNSKKPGPKPSRAVAEVAKVSGLSTKTVKEAIKTTKVSPEVKAAADDAGLTSKQRLAISRLPEADQLAGVSKMAAINVVADRTEKTAAAKLAKPMSNVARAAEPRLSEFKRTDGTIKPACDFNDEDAGDVAKPGDTKEMIRYRIFVHRASEALRHARENGFDKASTQEITDEILELAATAAKAWADVYATLQRRAKHIEQEEA